MQGNTKTIRQVITEYIRGQKKTEYFFSEKALSVWHEISEKYITSYQTRASIKYGKLYLHVDNAALRSDLMMRRTEIKQVINTQLNFSIIKEVVIC